MTTPNIQCGRCARVAPMVKMVSPAGVTYAAAEGWTVAQVSTKPVTTRQLCPPCTRRMLAVLNNTDYGLPVLDEPTELAAIEELRNSGVVARQSTPTEGVESPA